MLKLVDKIAQYLEEIILVICFSLMPLLCFFQVLCRFVIHFPAPWTEESMRALFVWSTFIGASVGVKYGSHLGVTAIVGLFPPKFRSSFMIVINLLCCLFCIFLVYSGLGMVRHQITTGQILPVTKIPVAWTTSCMPVGFSLMAFRFLYNAVQIFYKEFRHSQQEQGVVA
ncbi:TRAP transporter small permease [Moorella sulfitireducens]|uniref:TRAP transporter small permease n=1 Tax=Neomoorella sulfitireducens TaxID=2972948 RepID=UPI0021AB9B05|nr:TRAP transporter small permease [Moorella sulfitireducens]